MPTTYVQVAVNIPQVSGVFDYHLPIELQGVVVPGCLVEVPFGPRAAQGVVIREVETPQVAETRAVSALVDPEPVLTPAQMRLGEWLSERTLSPLAACLHCMLPSGLSQQSDILYQLLKQPQPDERAVTPLQEKLMALLRAARRPARPPDRCCHTPPKLESRRAWFGAAWGFVGSSCPAAAHGAPQSGAYCPACCLALTT